MLRLRLPRAARLLIAVLVGFAPPTLALAHGYAHHESHENEEHARQHAHGEGLGTSRSSHGEMITALRAGDDAQHHGHPQLCQAMAVRVGISLFVVMAPIASLPLDIVHVAAASLLLTAAPARAGPAHARPRQPRAPPIV